MSKSAEQSAEMSGMMKKETAQLDAALQIQIERLKQDTEQVVCVLQCVAVCCSVLQCIETAQLDAVLAIYIEHFKQDINRHCV